MENSKRIVYVALAFDQNFIIPLYVLLTSMFANNKQNYLSIHAVATGLSEEEKNKIHIYALENNTEIFFYNIDKSYIESFANAIDSRYGLATFYRLLLPELLPESVSKIIYTDVDVIITGDLFELQAVNIDNFPIAAVPDPVEWDRPDLGISDRKDYFNAGVLLINVPLWKSQNVGGKAIDFLRKNPELATYVDQDALNAVLINNWFKVDDKFNFTYRVVPYKSRKELRDLVKNKVIIHYNESTKPWHRLSTNKLDFLYHEYFQLSPLSGSNPYHPLILSPANLKRLAKLKLDYYYFNTPYLAALWRKFKS